MFSLNLFQRFSSFCMSMSSSCSDSSALLGKITKGLLNKSSNDFTVRKIEKLTLKADIKLPIFSTYTTLKLTLNLSEAFL